MNFYFYVFLASDSLVLSFRKRKKLKSCYCIYPFQNLSFWLIIIIFLKFCKFQPRYSYKMYPYKNKCVSCNTTAHTNLYEPQIPDVHSHPPYRTNLIRSWLKSPVCRKHQWELCRPSTRRNLWEGDFESEKRNQGKNP